MTADELRKVEAAYKAALAMSEQLRAERNELVLEAFADGMTHRQIADITGLSRGRISQLKPSSSKKRRR